MSAFNPDTLAEAELSALRDHHNELLFEMWAIARDLRGALRIWSSEDMRNRLFEVANRLEDAIVRRKPNIGGSPAATRQEGSHGAVGTGGTENKQLELFPR